MTALAAQAGPEAPSRRAVLGWWALAVTVRSSYVPLALCGAVMDLLAVLSAAGVRRSLIHTAALQGVLKSRGWRRALSAEAVDRALARLAGASLLPFSVDGSTISAHRLVMRVIRENLAARHSLTAVSEAAARLLDKLAESLRRRWHEDRAATGGLVEQIMALDESAARCPPGSDLDRRMILLRGRAVWFLNALGDSPAQAMVIGERLLADQEPLLGADQPDTLASRNNLAPNLGRGRTEFNAPTIHVWRETIRPSVTTNAAAD